MSGSSPKRGAAGTSLMPDIVADLPDPTCSRLPSGGGIQESQPLGIDPSSPRARDDAREGLRQGQLRQPKGPPPRHPQSQAARARSPGPAAEHSSAVQRQIIPDMSVLELDLLW